MIKPIKQKIRNSIISLLGLNKKFNTIFKPNIVNSTINSKAKIANLAFILNSKINKHTSVGRYSNILNAEIGKYCSISYFCTVGATQHPFERISTHAFPYIKDFGFVDIDKRFEEKVYIGNDVWIGASAIIMPKVKISDGVVVGAGAVVTKDVPPYAIVAGCPAKVLKYRFDEKTINSLLELKWWDLDEKLIKDNIKMFHTELTPEILLELKNLHQGKENNE